MLTPKQKRIYDYIVNFHSENGFNPSQNEIARQFKFRSLGTVQNYLIRLERHGLIQKNWNARRGAQAVFSQPHVTKNAKVDVELGTVPLPFFGSANSTPKKSLSSGAPPAHAFLGSAFSTPARSTATVELELLGSVAAGHPIEALESGEHVTVPAHLVKKNSNCFVLKVRGHSMIQEGIFDGDWVVIQKQVEARNGDTVVALVDHGATIKKFFKRAEKIELHPANPEFSVLHVNPELPFQIEGILCGLIRRY